MSINFCYEGLSNISCKHPSNDEHEVSNLISLDSAKRRKGFIVDYFVKPIVTIEVKFCCAINVHLIVINCSVGIQKSSIIEINTNNATNGKWAAYGKIGQGENGMVFHWNGRNINKDSYPSYKFHTFNNFFSLQRVTWMTIKIIRTENSTVPAIGGLEIWGGVSKLSTKETLNSVYRMWHRIKSSLNSNSNNRLVNSEEDDQKSESEVEETTEFRTGFKIPEEFIDPITFHILTVPMTLPCGKVVDITTLEKFQKTEAEWGRGQSDPFTGLPFTERRKPIVAASLKERLDKFLLKHADNPNIKCIPRTVGKKVHHSNETPLYNPSVSTSVQSHSFPPPPVFKRTRDVDSLLESSLSGLPSFLEKPPEKKIKNDCMKCNSEVTLFRLNCRHLICRQCLIILKKSAQGTCDCGITIEYGAIERFHPD